MYMAHGYRIQTCLRHGAAEPSLETPHCAETSLSFDWRRWAHKQYTDQLLHLQYSPRVSWTIALSTLAISSTDSVGRFHLKSCSWSLKSLTSSSVYGARTSSSTVPESSICSIDLYLISPTLSLNRFLNYCTTVLIRTKNIKLVPIALRTETI